MNSHPPAPLRSSPSAPSRSAQRSITWSATNGASSGSIPVSAFTWASAGTPLVLMVVNQFEEVCLH